MEVITLQDALVAVADAVRDVVEGTTTASINTPTQMQDATKIGGKDKMWQGSEVVFLEPDATTAGMTGSNPYEVTDFNASSGLFTLNKNFASGNGVPSNVRYLLLRARGQGNPYRSYLRAIRYALDKLDTSTDSRDTSLTTAADTFEYTIPAGLDTIYDVVFHHATLGHYALRPDWWDIAPGRKLVLLNRNLTVASLWTLWLYGTTYVDLPAALSGTMRVPLEELVQQAEEYLRRTSPRQQEAARAGNLTQERLRFTQTRVHPNEKELY